MPDHPFVDGPGTTFMHVEPADLALSAAVMAHLGFQVTVTALVYPALVRLGLSHPEEWTVAHDRHSRTIVPVVGAVYVGLLGAGLWALSSGLGPASLIALVGAWGAVAVTGTLAAPLHGRLGAPEPLLLSRLLVIDRVRCLLALGAGIAALALLLG